ncbi:MAG TPA: hypothetical protein VE219_04535, partial [Candidatus Sulfotelmatobacter sp.]|nr:hypothetical protein [Candidatus Sulfotelmatobacter sp.]
VLSSLILTSGVLLLTMQRIFLGPAREIFRRVKDATALELTYVAPLLAGLVFFGLVGGRVVPLIAKGVGPIARQLSGG